MGIITDYASLKTEIAAMLVRDDLTAAIPGYVQAAENRIYRELRVRQMRQAATVAFTAGDNTEDLPEGYLEMQSALVVGTPYTYLERVNREAANALFPLPNTGRPRYFTTNANNLSVFPVPDTAYTLSINYYRREPAMVANEDAPWLITDAPDLIFYASLVQAHPAVKDDGRIQIWEQFYTTQRDALRDSDKAEQYAGSKPRGRFR